MSLSAQYRPRLIAAVTKYDDAQAKRNLRTWNPSALRLYTEAAERALADMDNGATPAAAISAAFNDRLRDHVLRSCGFSPASIPQNPSLLYTPAADA
jgi:hypothetical protein